MSPSTRLAAACLLTLVVTALPLRARGQGHESHHPGVASAEPSTEAAADADPSSMGEQGGGMMGGGAGGGMGGGMMGGGAGEGRARGMGMPQMMDAMRRPKSTELFPTLLELPATDDRERADLERRATARMSEGAAVLSEALRALSAAAYEGDLEAMGRAVRGAREGLSQLESAIAVRRTLSEGGSGRATALRWFQSELGLLPPHTATPPRRILGMAPFELFICSLLIVAVGIGLWLYALRMRRASELLERLAAGASTDPPEEEESAPATRASRDSPAPAPPPSPSPGEEPPHWGLLPVVRKKLCRLRVARVFQETPDVKTFRLVSCDRGPIPFSYLPGQFLTLMLPVGEKPIRRSYTISSAPTQGYYCEITVKREEQGQGSRFLHDELVEGQTLEVRAPSGKFTFTGSESESIVLIAGGVGITPMMSVARALTDMAWRGEIHFIAACRDPEHFIFAAELDRMEREHPNLHVHVAMSRLEDDVPGIHRGRLTKERLAEWVPEIASQRIHLCGAPAMMDATKSMLAELGVPDGQIHTESFGSDRKPGRTPPDAKPAPAVDAFDVVFERSSKSTRLLPGETVLEAAERIGVDIDYSCRVGSCGECAIRLSSGEVRMEVEDALEPQDKAAGVILACQARATSNLKVEA